MLGGTKPLMLHLARESHRAVMSPVLYMSHAAPRASTATSAATQNSPPGDQTLKTFDEMPGPTGLPLVGTLFDYVGKNGYGFRQMFKVFTSRRDEFGPVYRETLGNLTSVIVSDPDEYAKVIRADGQMPHRLELGPLAHFRRIRGIKLGTVNSQGPDWHRMRIAVSKKALRVKGILDFCVPMSRVADDLAARIDKLAATSNNRVASNLEMEVFKWAFESLGVFLFEERLGCFADPPEENAERYLTHLLGFFKEMQNLLFSMPLYTIYRTAAWKRFEIHADTVHQLARQIVQKKIKLLEQEERLGKLATNGECSFLTYLLQQKDVPPDEAALHTIDFMIGGVETTSTALIWTLYLLARTPEVQQALYDEVSRVLPPGEDVTASRLANMPYVKACLKETFRIYPITFATSRILQEPLEIGGYIVPPGIHIQANLWGMGHDPELFPEPERYHPERWLRGNEEVLDPRQQSAKNFGTLPWGHGARMCLGRRIAEQELYLALIKIIQRFEVRFEGTLEPVLNTVITPDRPVLYQFIPRTPSPVH